MSRSGVLTVRPRSQNQSAKENVKKYYGINVELLAGFSGFTAFPMDGDPIYCLLYKYLFVFYSVFVILKN